jgi:DNA polymerase-3 subunit gamma/tau
VTYQVLARTWRPQSFADLMGQEAVVRTLQNALGADTLGHAYLFSGLRGVGKTTVARLLAKAVNCEQGPTANPCGECSPCQEITNGSSLDVVELDGASNRGIDDVRELRELLRYRPTRDRFRVIIVDEVHMLTREAFNALLKSLEEPPPHVLFIFATTERHKVPPTILSRCQQLDFRPVAHDLIARRLSLIAEQEGFTIAAGAAAAIARAAEGSVRDALSLLDQLRAFSGDAIDEAAVATVLGVPPIEQIASLIQELAAGDAAAALKRLRQELAAGHDATLLFQECGRMLKTLLHLCLDPELEPTLTAAQQTLLRGIATPLGAGALSRMLGLWLAQESMLRDSHNRELALEVSCLRLARWPAVQQLEALLRDDSALAASAAGSPGAAGPTGAAPPSEPGAAPAADSDPSPGGRLSSALWEARRPQLSAAVERAQVRLLDEAVVISFPSSEQGLARFASTNEARSVLDTTCQNLFATSAAVRIEVEGEQDAAGDDDGSLIEAARRDPQAAMVQRVFGGEITRAWPERDRS